MATTIPDIEKRIAELQMRIDAIFASADGSKRGCFGRLIDTAQPHDICVSCGFLKDCRKEAQERILAAAPALEQELRLAASIRQFEAEAAHIHLAKEEDGSDMDPAETLPIGDKPNSRMPEVLKGFDWNTTIKKLEDAKPGTIAAAARMVRADLQAVGFKPKYFSHYTYYSDKLLKNLEIAGKVKVNREAKTLEWA